MLYVLAFVYAMSFASTLISSGIYKKILIVASETYSKHMTTDDRNCVFFGDGARGSNYGYIREWMERK